MDDIKKLEVALAPKLKDRRGRPRSRAVFGPIPCDANLFALLKKKKKRGRLNWEEALSRMGMEWLKNGK